MNRKKKIDLSDALLSIRPNAQFVLIGEDFSNIKWLDKNVPLPTLEELNEEKERLQNIEDANDYKRLRRNEYPPIEDYIDAVVKQDNQLIQAYIDKCNAVKLKYPKNNN